jgi:hypothetical protein
MELASVAASILTDQRRQIDALAAGIILSTNERK